MAERKVTSKYYPPEFDPSDIATKSKNGRKPRGLPSIPVRLMAPFSMKCTNCGEFIYKGRKFNSRKETVEDQYIKVPIYRFYIKCTDCKSEITFRTDPKNHDYVCERGATRNSEAWRDADDAKYQDETMEETLDRLAAELGEEEVQQERDKMADLEDKMQDSKREMEIGDALDEIRTRNARIERNMNVLPEPIPERTIPTDWAAVKSNYTRPPGVTDEEDAAFEAEIAILAYKAFHDEDGNFLVRDDNGQIIRRFTPAQEAAGVHLLPGARSAAPFTDEEKHDAMIKSIKWEDTPEEAAERKARYKAIGANMKAKQAARKEKLKAKAAAAAAAKKPEAKN